MKYSDILLTLIQKFEESESVVPKFRTLKTTNGPVYLEVSRAENNCLGVLEYRMWVDGQYTRTYYCGVHHIEEAERFDEQIVDEMLRELAIMVFKRIS